MKRVGATSRFGPRYGTKVRKLVLELEERAKQPQKCPSCSAFKVRRISTSIWQCRRCGVKFASGAYLPTPPLASEKKGGEGR